MVKNAVSIANQEPAPSEKPIGIPAQRTRGGQPDLRRVTLPSRSPSIPDPPAVPPRQPDGPPPPTPGRMSRSDRWLRSHRTVIFCGDAAVILIAVLVAQLVTVDVDLNINFSWPTRGFGWLSGLVVALGWLVSLAVEGVWHGSALRNSRSEHRRILLASLMVFAVVGIVGYLTMVDLARTFLLIVAPLGIAGLLVNHWLWRRRFAAFRRSAAHQHAMVVLGDRAGAGDLCTELREGLDSNYEVNGVWALRDRDSGSGAAPLPAAPNRVAGLPAPGDRAGSVGAAALADSRAAGVTAAMSFAPDQQTAPAMTARRSIGKRTLDLTVAVTGLLLLLPLLIAAAVVVLLADGGPVLHQQECVGRSGKVFKRWTFRCAPYGAKARPTSGSPSSEGAARVGYDVATTSVGRLLTRTGLACAPGLFNVLAGQMSVVGPRPMAPGDVAAHPAPVPPGLTGRWRLADASGVNTGNDVRDVQQWSVAGDMTIIMRSLRLAITGRLPC